MPAEMEPTYDVRFRARDLWPDASDEALNHVAVFQSYLEKPFRDQDLLDAIQLTI
jgi:nitrile hydratase subunit beta